MESVPLKPFTNIFLPPIPFNFLLIAPEVLPLKQNDFMQGLEIQSDSSHHQNFNMETYQKGACYRRKGYQILHKWQQQM